MEVRYGSSECMPVLPQHVSMQREGDMLRLTYEQEQISASELLNLLQQAGPIRELTMQSRNIDYLIADMYREMGL